MRVAVEGGGCSGFQYTFNMEEVSSSPENLRSECDDMTFGRDNEPFVLVDSGSFQLIKGPTIDYVQEMIKNAFAVTNNPQSESACGCGSSFALKTFASNPAKD